MKNILIAFLVSMASMPLAYSQNVLDGIYLKSERELTADIDSSRQAIINQLGNCRKIEKSKDASGYEYFYMSLKDDELKLVVLKSNVDDIEKRVSWYFKNERLIFAEQIWIDIKTNALINHEKYYADMGHIVIWVKSDNTMADVHSDDFKPIEKELLAYAEKLKIVARR